MKYFLFLLTFAHFGALAEALDISCKLYGLNTEKNQYETVVEGQFSLDTDCIADKPNAAPFIKEAQERYPDFEVSMPLGNRSKLFRSPGGTQLGISVWIYHNDPDNPYAFQTVNLNGFRVHSSIPLDSQYSRMIFNTDRLDNPALVEAPSQEDLILTQEPIILSEGVFKFLYSDCAVSWPDREEDKE